MGQLLSAKYWGYFVQSSWLEIEYHNRLVKRVKSNIWIEYRVALHIIVLFDLEISAYVDDAYLENVGDYDLGSYAHVGAHVVRLHPNRTHECDDGVHRENDYVDVVMFRDDADEHDARLNGAKLQSALNR